MPLPSADLTDYNFATQISSLSNAELSFQITMKVSGYSIDAVGLEPTANLEVVAAALRDGKGNYVMAYQRLTRVSIHSHVPEREMTYEVRKVKTDSRGNDELLRLLSLEFIERTLSKMKETAPSTLTVEEFLINLRAALKPKGSQPLVKLQIRNCGFVDAKTVQDAIDQLETSMLSAASLRQELNALEKLAVLVLRDSANL